MKKLYFIRHGLTDRNIAGVVSGQSPASLVDAGREQAMLAGKELINRGIHVDLIIASPLERTLETAQIVAKTIGYPTDQIVTNDLLQERNFGILEGTRFEEFLDGHVYRDVDEVEGAETIEQVQARAEQAIAFAQSLPQDTILFVSHGGIGRAFRRAAQGQPFIHEYTDPFVQIKNAEILELA